MADEAYRAVFLRVHPTGKMVLSLTTEADGNEAGVRAARRRRARRAGARRQGRPGRHRPLRHRARLQHEPVRRRARRRSPAHREDPRQGPLLAGMALERRPTTLKWADGAWVAGDGSDPTQVKTIEDVALYAHGTGELPPASRAAGRPDRLQGLAQAVRVDLDLDLVQHLQRPEQGGVRLHAPVRLLDDRRGGQARRRRSRRRS